MGLTFSGVFVILIVIGFGIWFTKKYFVFDDTKKKKIQEKKDEINTIEELATEVPEVDTADLQEKQNKVDNFID